MKYRNTNIEDRLIYDKGTHRFSLNAEEMENIVQELIRYGSDVDIQQELDAQSEMLYDWIYSMIPNSNIPYVEYQLAKNRNLRAIIYSALYEILLGDLHSNNTQARFHLGANFKTGMVMARTELRASLITESVKQKFENIPGNLLTTRPFNVYMDPDRYAKEDY